MSENGKDEDGVTIRINHTASEYKFEGFNRNNPDRVIIRSKDGDLVGTVDTKCCTPVDTTWEELKKNKSPAV